MTHHESDEPAAEREDGTGAQRDDRRRRAAEQEKRAQQAIASIMNGGDLGEETTRLSNEFTDAQTARLRAWLGRGLRPFRRKKT